MRPVPVRTWAAAAAATLFAAAAAHAACPANAVRSCTVNGVQGTQSCDGLRWSLCSAAEEDPVTATVSPSFMVLTVVYAPPGNAAGAPSSVSYANGSSAGSTTSGSSSFESGIKVTAEALSESIGGSFTFKRNSVSSSSIDITKGASQTIEHSGSRLSDGLNNDLDAIYIALRPTVTLQTPPLKYGVSLRGAVVQFLHAGWLRDPATMPSNIKATLTAAGVKETDFAKILRASIYHEGGPVAASNARLIPVNDNVAIPYEPPFAAGEAPSRQTVSIDAKTTSASSTEIARSYSAGVTSETPVPKIFKLKTETSFTWTNTRAAASSQSTTESATVTITGPSFGYTGPTAYRVFLDSLYKTFVFQPLPPGSFVARGRLVRGGVPVAAQEVVAVVAGKRYKTWTNSRGQYFVYAPRAASVEIRAAGQRRVFGTIPASKRLADMKVG